MRVLTDQGLSVNFNGVNIGLDHNNKRDDLIFISHAHTDHLVRNPDKPVICSDLTASLASLRVNSDYELTSMPGASLLDSGHVAGGKALLLEGGGESLLYTGDFSPHDRFFLNGLKPVKVDHLVIETTYGLPSYDFPAPFEPLTEARRVIEADLMSDRQVVLWGYAFGKAQLLMKLVEGLGPVHAHQKIRVINDVCLAGGLSLPESLPFSSDFSIYLTPSRKELKGFPDARVYSFTGWGARGVSDCFRVSDHASFSDLLRFVKACDPERVYCHHGFSEEFAALLRVEGFDALAV